MLFAKKKSLVKIGGLLGVLLLLVALYYFMRSRTREGFESGAVVTYFFLPECPWCKAFKPEWDKFVELAKKEGIQTVAVDASDEANREEVSRKGVKGFPTVIVSKDKDHEFTGERTAAELLKFVKALP
jgi:thiol-disulfide isomerase/thioredoxin